MIGGCGMSMTNRAQKTHYIIGWMIASLMTVVLFAGCAEKGPILLSVGYQPEEGKTAAAQNIVVGVSPFKDSRDAAPSLLGTRTVPSGMRNDLVVTGTVAGVVTAALKDALKARGLAVKDVPSWDLTAENIKAEGARLLFGGEIKTLRLDSKASSLSTSVTAVVQIKIFAGDVAEKKIIRTLDVQSRVDQGILYSRDRLESVLSEALTSALNQIFQDDVLSKRLQP